MSRLSRNQREQATGRLEAGQCAQIVANAYNQDHLPSPHHDKIALFCANIYLQDRFSTTNEMARHTTGTQQRPISADTVSPWARPEFGITKMDKA